jgi:hypothetical protein
MIVEFTPFIILLNPHSTHSWSNLLFLMGVAVTAVMMILIMMSIIVLCRESTL